MRTEFPPGGTPTGTIGRVVAGGTASKWTDYYSANPDHGEPAPEPHSLRRAFTFKDRVAAFTLAGLLLANLVLIGVRLQADLNAKLI
ncbi:MAG: hypothetical protein WDM88_00335 [Galbitalea sp.]